MNTEQGALSTCALDADCKETSRLLHLAALMLNSSLVLSVIIRKARGLESPYVTLGQLHQLITLSRSQQRNVGKVYFSLSLSDLFRWEVYRATE